MHSINQQLCCHLTGLCDCRLGLSTCCFLDWSIYCGYYTCIYIIIISQSIVWRMVDRHMRVGRVKSNSFNSWWICRRYLGPGMFPVCLKDEQYAVSLTVLYNYNTHCDII